MKVSKKNGVTYKTVTIFRLLQSDSGSGNGNGLAAASASVPEPGRTGSMTAINSVRAKKPRITPPPH